MTATQEQQSYLFENKVTARKTMAITGRGNFIDIEDPLTGDVHTLIDGCTGAAVGSLDHCDPEIQKVISQASKECVYSFPLFVCNHWAEKLAEFIITHSPKGAFSAATFACSGSEANENALRIIRQYFLEKGEPQRVKIISRKHSYHGYTIGALSIGDSYPFKDYSPIFLPHDQTIKVSECNPYHNMKKGETLEQYKNRLLEEIDEAFIAAGPDTVEAFICETVSGSSLGCQTSIPGYLEGVKKICDKYGALFMLDEVMCGLGRCGTYHAWEQFLPDGVYPDIQTVGKTIGSDYVTLSGILISPKVKNAIVNGSGMIVGSQTFHCHSFNCRVALAVQKKIFRENLIQNSKDMGEYLSEQLEEKIGKHKYVGFLKGDGLFRGVEFVQNKETKEPFDPKIQFSMRLLEKCFANGLTIMANHGCYKGDSGDIIIISPAFTIKKETIDKIVNILAKSLDDVTKDVDALN